MNQMILGIVLGFMFSTVLYLVGAVHQYIEIKKLKLQLKSANEELSDFRSRKSSSPSCITVDLVKEYYLLKSPWGFYGINPDPSDSSCHWVLDPYKAIRFSDYFDLDMFVHSSQYHGSNMPFEIVKLNMFVI